VLNIPIYQGQLTLTTTGTSGAATLSGDILNIPQYSGGGGTPAGSAGQVQFNSTPAGSFAASANLAWDNAAVQLNIGAPLSPTGKLNINGGGTTSATVNTRLTDSGNTELVKVLDNGSTNIGTNFNWDNTNGRLGIGVTSPSQRLHVSGSAIITGSNGTATTLMGRDASGNISAVNLTTTGTGGAATISGNNLNIPIYSGGASPGGASGNVQFNNGGAFGGSANFNWDNSNFRLSVGPITTASQRVQISGSAGQTPGFRILNSGIAIPNFSGVGYSPAITTTTVAMIEQAGGSDGGIAINGFSATTGGIQPLFFTGIHGVTSPGTVASCLFRGFKWNGTNTITAVTADEIVAEFSAGNTAVFDIRANGNVNIGSKFTPSARLQVRGANTTAAVGTFIVEDGAATPATIYRIDNNGKVTYRATNTAAGTTGPQTINQPSGTVNFGIGDSALVVTNSLCTTSSIVFATVRTNDATATIKNVVPAAGSFTINLGANATAETSVGFFIIN
jgi:hypothetical protein